MNRAGRREVEKQLRKAGVSKNSAKSIVKRNELLQQTFDKECWEGEKVKLNYDRLINYPDYKEMRKSYREWVEANKDNVFTVEFDPKRKEKNAADVSVIVELAEDTTEPKWLFHVVDLIPEPGQTKPEPVKDEKLVEFEKHIDEVKSQLK